LNVNVIFPSLKREPSHFAVYVASSPARLPEVSWRCTLISLRSPLVTVNWPIAPIDQVAEYEAPCQLHTPHASALAPDPTSHSQMKRGRWAGGGGPGFACPKAVAQGNDAQIASAPAQGLNRVHVVVEVMNLLGLFTDGGCHDQPQRRTRPHALLTEFYRRVPARLAETNPGAG
jgi:hypothetical protein